MWSEREKIHFKNFKTKIYNPIYHFSTQNKTKLCSGPASRVHIGV